MIEKIIPAKDPSNVLFGLTLGKAFRTPKNLPTRYAEISLKALTIKTEPSRNIPLSIFRIRIEKLIPKPIYRMTNR